MESTSNVPAVYPIIVPTSPSLKSFNFYLVENENALILVDAGIDTDKCWDHFKSVLKENEWKVEDIDKIILTHNHHDHTGLVNRIRRVKDIPVYAHPEAIVRLKRDHAFMQNRILFFKKMYAEMGCGMEGEKQVEKLKRAVVKNKGKIVEGKITSIQEGDTVDGFQILETPGHAPDHIALFHPESGIFLGGDHLIQHVSSNALIEPDQQGKKISSLLQYEKSLEKCRQYPLAVVYPGHGETVKEPNALIEKRLKGIEAKSEKIKSVIQEKSYTAAKVAQKYYKEKYETEFSLVMSEIIGHLDRLVALNKISKERRGNELYYRSVSISV